MASQSWTIVIFCYNEEKTITPVYESVLNVLKNNLSRDFEIVIVDDGSTDHSVNEIHKLQQKFPAFTKVILHPKNLGIGRALRSGYTNSQFENICSIPADGQFDIHELIPYLDFDDRTFISFYRKEKHNSSFGINLSSINRKINSLFLSMRLRDVNWVKAFKSKEIKSFEWKLNSSLIESELCAKLLAKGAQAIEVESVYHPGQPGINKKKGAFFRIVFLAMQETLKLIFIMILFKRKLRK